MFGAERGGSFQIAHRPSLADTYFVPGPQWARRLVVDHRLAFAFYFNYCGRLVRRLQRQPSQPQREFVLDKPYRSSRFKQSGGPDLCLETADRDHRWGLKERYPFRSRCAPRPIMLMNI